MMYSFQSLNFRWAIFSLLTFGNVARSDPSCSGTSSDGRTIGYYGGWNVDRGCEMMPPQEIPLGYYTHINFAFAVINPYTFNMMDMEASMSSLYDQVTALKQRQQGLQTWISIGGWNFNDPGATQTTFSNLAASPTAQSNFFTSLISFINKHDFDGVDFDWEYPAASDRGGVPGDFVNYVTFLRNLRAALDKGETGKRIGLSITLPSSSWYLQGFDIVNIEPIVDWFNMMTYDLHGVWDANSGANFVESHTNLTEIETILELLWNKNIDPNKVSLGLAFYGRSFTLSNPSCKAAGCPFSGAGNPGPCTDTSGILSSIEIRDIISNGGNVTFNSVAAAEIVTWDENQWVSYDDGKTLNLKQGFANNHCLGGTFIWSIDLDDGTLIDAMGSYMSRPKATVKSS